MNFSKLCDINLCENYVIINDDDGFGYLNMGNLSKNKESILNKNHGFLDGRDDGFSDKIIFL